MTLTEKQWNCLFRLTRGRVYEPTDHRSSYALERRGFASKEIDTDFPHMAWWEITPKGRELLQPIIDAALESGRRAGNNP